MNRKAHTMLLDKFTISSPSDKRKLLQTHISITKSQRKTRHNRHNGHIIPTRTNFRTNPENSQSSHRGRRNQFTGSHRTDEHARNLDSTRSLRVRSDNEKIDLSLLGRCLHVLLKTLMCFKHSNPSMLFSQLNSLQNQRNIFRRQLRCS